MVVVVETTTILATLVWISLQTWPNYPARLYRLRSP
jgi:hypothetical protein